MIRRPPRSTRVRSSAASDVYKRQVLSTVQNSGAKFSNNGFAILVNRSHGDDLLATKVGMRPDLPLQLFEQLIEAASDAARSKLETEIPHARHNIHRVVNNVAAQI